MANRWIVRRGDKESPPLTSEKLVQLAKAGKVRPDDMIRAEGQTDWHAAREVKGLFPKGAAAVSTPQPSTPSIHAKPVDTAPIPARRSDIGYDSPLQQDPVLTVNVVTPKRSSSLGIASVILGVVALLLCWIPFVGVISLPLSGLGLLLGIIGLLVAITRQGSGIGYPIAGTAVGGLALLVGISQVFVITEMGSAIADAGGKSTRTNQETVTPSSPARSESKPKDDDLSEKPPSGNPSSQTPEPSKSEPADEWVLASHAVKQGDTQVKTVSARVGKVGLTESFGRDESASQNSLLAIELEITNVSRNRKIEYKSFMGADVSFKRDYATLTDNFDNGYKRITFGFGTKVKGATESDSVYPGKSIRDVLVFQEPLETVEYLNLELPAKNFGGTGMLRIRIPAKMIRWDR